MKIYMVSQGEYSDYGVLALYTNREAAEAHVALLNVKPYGYDAFVEEREADESNRNFLVYQVDLFPSPDQFGQVEGEPVLERNFWPTVRPDIPAPHITMRRHDRQPSGSAYGTSYEAAEKSLFDALAKFKAEQLDAERATLAEG